MTFFSEKSLLTDHPERYFTHFVRVFGFPVWPVAAMRCGVWVSDNRRFWGVYVKCLVLLDFVIW